MMVSVRVCEGSLGISKVHETVSNHGCKVRTELTHPLHGWPVFKKKTKKQGSVGRRETSLLHSFKLSEGSSKKKNTEKSYSLIYT